MVNVGKYTIHGWYGIHLSCSIHPKSVYLHIHTWMEYGLFEGKSRKIQPLFPKQCGNTWGSYGSGKKPGWLDRGGGRVAHRFHRYFRGFVLACSFRL